MPDRCFSGDNNEFLRWVQQDMCGKALYHLVRTVRRKYLDACYLVGCSSDFSSEIQNMNQFDHSILQRDHDMIAAWYRYRYADRVTQFRLPFSEQARHPMAALRGEYMEDWWRFWWEETDRISGDGHVVRAILKAIVYQDLAKGIAAEGLVWASFVDRYDATEWVTWLRQRKPKALVLPKW